MYLSYDGGAYSGWQVQPNGLSVQEVIEKSLSTVLRIPTSIVGAGRTDAGVHAKSMVAHFDTSESLSDLDTWVKKLNSILPKDIAIQKIVEVQADAHARFDAVSRLYKYYVTIEKDPFGYKYKHRVMKPLDIRMMNACAEVLLDYEDFTSFSKLHTDVKTNNCKVLFAQWEKHESDYIFTIKANRFLRNMVRAIAGTLLDAGVGKLDVAGMHKIIKAKDRGVAGISAPGHALFLEQVEYNNTIINKESI